MTDPRRDLPAVNTLLDEATRVGLLDRIPHAVVVDSIRAVLEEARMNDCAPPEAGWIEAVVHHANEHNRPTLVGVVNATGVVLHTNLGRAPLAAKAYEAAREALGYSTLEFDTGSGKRGSRQQRIRKLLKEVQWNERKPVILSGADLIVGESFFKIEVGVIDHKVAGVRARYLSKSAPFSPNF